MNAYYFEVRWDVPRVVEFQYEKKTAQNYMQCKPVGVIVGGKYGGYMSRRIPLENACDDLSEAMRRVACLLAEGIERKKAQLNDVRSRLGEVEAIARTLGVDLKPAAEVAG